MSFWDALLAITSLGRPGGVRAFIKGLSKIGLIALGLLAFLLLIAMNAPEFFTSMVVSLVVLLLPIFIFGKLFRWWRN